MWIKPEVKSTYRHAAVLPLAPYPPPLSPTGEHVFPLQLRAAFGRGWEADGSQLVLVWWPVSKLHMENQPLLPKGSLRHHLQLQPLLASTYECPRRWYVTQLRPSCHHYCGCFADFHPQHFSVVLERWWGFEKRKKYCKWWACKVLGSCNLFHLCSVLQDRKEHGKEEGY